LDRAFAEGRLLRRLPHRREDGQLRGGEAMLELRGSGDDRYALALTAGGALEIRRYRAGLKTCSAAPPAASAI